MSVKDLKSILFSHIRSIKSLDILQADDVETRLKNDEIDLDKTLDYLINKSITKKLLKTLSAYTMIEVDDKVYLSSYGFADSFFNVEAGEEALLQKVRNKESDFYMEYDSYGDLLLSQLPQIQEDIEDLGVDNFYLSNYELQYLNIDY